MRPIFCAVVDITPLAEAFSRLFFFLHGQMPFLAIRLKSLSVLIRIWDPLCGMSPRDNTSTPPRSPLAPIWVLRKNWRRDGISYAFLRSLPSPRRKQSSAAQPCFHKHVDHGLAIVVAGKSCLMSRPLKKPDAALLFVIIASVKIPPLVRPPLLDSPPPAAPARARPRRSQSADVVHRQMSHSF